MSYSLYVPNIEVGIDVEELKTRVLETASAVGLVGENAAPGVLDRITRSAESALLLADEVLDAPDDGSVVVSLSLSGHVAQNEFESDTCGFSVSVTPKRLAVE